MQEENQHSLQRKQGAGVRSKETGSEENYGHNCSFLNNYIEVWLIFIVALSSAEQQCDSVIHTKSIHFSYSFSCGLSLNIEYSSLRSTVGLCCFPFLCFPNSQSSAHHTLPHGNLMSCPCLVLVELSYPLLLRKPLDTYQKREIKQRTVLGLDIGGSHR